MSAMEVERVKGKWTFGGVVAATFLIAFVLLIFYCGLGFFGMGGHTKGQAQRVSCLSNMKQLGMGIQLYCDDNDGTLPVAMGQVEHYYESGLGWAGKILGYTKYDKSSQYSSLTCPSDYIAHRGEELPSGFKRLSYAFNSNLISVKPRIAEATGKTVMLFEVDGGMMNPDLPDEGRRESGGTYLSMSPVGSGINGDLYDHIGTLKGPSLGQSIWYATGLLDNSVYSGLPDTFGGREGRHMEKSNFVMADLSSKNRGPLEVSAGKTAHAPSDTQSVTGCTALPQGKGLNSWPCAAGSSDSRHALTFSPI